MKDALVRLFEHLEWANGLVLDALHDAPRPDPEALRLFAHVLAAEDVWYTRIRERAPRYPVWPTLTLEECARLSSENREAYAELLATTSDAQLASPVRYRNSAGFEFANALGDVLMHVALHGHYHRGQIARQLRADGRTPPYTDFIGFARREQEGGTLDAGRARGAQR